MPWAAPRVGQPRPGVSCTEARATSAPPSRPRPSRCSTGRPKRCRSARRCSATTEAACCCWCGCRARALGWRATDRLKALGGAPLGAPLGVHSRRHAGQRQSGPRRRRGAKEEPSIGERVSIIPRCGRPRAARGRGGTAANAVFSRSSRTRSITFSKLLVHCLPLHAATRSLEQQRWRRFANGGGGASAGRASRAPWVGAGERRRRGRPFAARRQQQRRATGTCGHDGAGLRLC